MTGPKSPLIYRKYLPTSRPCWRCSRQLYRMMSGPHKGMYVGAVILGFDKFYHLVHIACVDGVPLDVTAVDEEYCDHDEEADE